MVSYVSLLAIIMLSLGVQTVADICDLPAKTGPCRANLRRYYFDRHTGKCQEFRYGGCDGNANNFESEAACKKACGVGPRQASSVCNLDAETGPCLAIFHRFYFNRTTSQCQSFIYGGCRGNENNFKTVEECNKMCRVRPRQTSYTCDLEPEAGFCRGHFPRFYFDSNTGQCQQFIYGGCHGNENNFETEEECNIVCPAEKTCFAKPDSGNCYGYFPTFYYDAQTGNCEQFIYGGCGGNGNRYETEDECLDNCGDLSSRQAGTICDLEPKTGRCRAAFRRFYFNRRTGRCQEFIYGGCDGNANNFRTIEECNQQCRVRSAANVCELPAETGLCRAYIERYYFDKRKGTCQIFVYGGCGGNGNNFRTIQECKYTCPK